MNCLTALKPASILAAAAFVLAGAAACVPTVSRPTLNEVRMGQARSAAATDPTLERGDIRGEIAEIDLSRREIRVVTEGGRREIVPVDRARTRVVYHGREYAVENLQAGDVIAFQPASRSGDYVEIVRIYEPVQARATSGIARRPSLPPRSVVEGTVERVNHELGIFEVKPQRGNTVTVSVPYNARPGDVDDFKRLRRGDHVRVEGEFVSSDNLQLLAILSPKDR
jgi:hypothetical protein